VGTFFSYQCTQYSTSRGTSSNQRYLYKYHKNEYDNSNRYCCWNGIGIFRRRRTHSNAQINKEKERSFNDTSTAKK
jgi:hypothetical protein